MQVGSAVDVVPAPAPSLVASLPGLSAYLSYPKLKVLEQIPEQVRSTLDPIWSRDTVHCPPVEIFHFKNVCVASEGLVFDDECRLIEVTRTYHNDLDIVQARQAILDGRQAGELPHIPNAILAKSRGSKNYGHFIYEVLPRAWLARTHLNLTDWPAVIHASSSVMEKVARQALRCAGFSDAQVAVTTSTPVQFDDLIFVHGLTGHSVFLSPLVMQYLDAMTSHIPPGPAERLYVSRAPATVRDFEDEPRAAAILASIGYRRVVPAELSFEEQVSMFRGAKEIVGIAGAALTNTAFCRPGTRVVAFHPCSAAEVLFWMIAEARRLRYEEVRCPETGPQTGSLPWDRAIAVSKIQLTDAMRG